MSVVDTVHGRYVHNRRVSILAGHLADILPRNASLLDIGCGDGLLAKLVSLRRPDLIVKGLDVLIRRETHIDVQPFDGTHIPGPSGQVDVALFVDVIHHIEDPLPLLREAIRVSKGSLVIKDHLRDGLLAGPTLRMMDYVGNARHGVALPHNYWTKRQWDATFTELHLSVAAWRDQLSLYPIPADWIFGRGLHFLARLDIRR